MIHQLLPTDMPRQIFIVSVQFNYFCDIAQFNIPFEVWKAPKCYQNDEKFKTLAGLDIGI